MISLLVIYMIMIKVSAVTSTLWQGLEKEVTLGASHVSWRTNWTQGKTLKSVPWLWMTNGEFKGLAFVLVFQKKLDENSVDLRKTVIGDERWCFLCDPETKRQSLHWKITTFPTSPKAHMSKSQIAGLLLCLSAICRTFRCGGQESIQLITCTHAHAHAHTHTCWWPTRCTAAVHSEESIQLITHTHTHTHTCWQPIGCSAEMHSRVHPAHHTHTCTRADCTVKSPSNLHTNTHTHVLMAHRMLRVAQSSPSSSSHTHTCWRPTGCSAELHSLRPHHIRTSWKGLSEKQLLPKSYYEIYQFSLSEEVLWRAL